MRAVVVDEALSERIALREVLPPEVGDGEALVQVAATSLNFGEVRRALKVAPSGFRPGWDVAGTIIKAAKNGSGYPAGTRVLGFVEGSAWSEQVAIAARVLARIPSEVTFAQAATLPVAGLTAYFALAQGGLLVAKRVLVVGASGGVGHLACQIARAAGATVIGVGRRADTAAQIREDGAHEVYVGNRLAEAAVNGRFDLILESVGGELLADAMGLLAPDGVCVTYGESAGHPAAFDPRSFFRAGGARLYGLFLYEEVHRHPPAAALTRLLELVADERLKPRITVDEPWENIASVAHDLMARKISGKAVLRIAG